MDKEALKQNYLNQKNLVADKPSYAIRMHERLAQNFTMNKLATKNWMHVF